MPNSKHRQVIVEMPPLTMDKTGFESDKYGSRIAPNTYSSPHMTPPTTPDGIEDVLDMATTSTPDFHSYLRAFCGFQPKDDATDSTVTLALNAGDVIMVHSLHTNGWADGSVLISGARGWLPTNYCEPYEPDELRSLLKAQLNFHDLMQNLLEHGHELLATQECLKGFIAGVRYLLECTHCLTRESPTIQRNEDLRKCRKSILSELSSLVKTTRRVPDSRPESEQNYAKEQVGAIVDELIYHAFRVITKAIRFLDTWEEDRRSRAPAFPVMATVREEVVIPPTPPADETTFHHAGTRLHGIGPVAESNAAPPEGEAAQSSAPVNRRLSLVQTDGATTRPMSQTLNRLSSTMSHRVSLVGPSLHSRPQHLVSKRLTSCHDTFLSHLGSFISRVQLQSQSRPHLATTIKQSASSGVALLVVMEVIGARSTSTVDFLDQSLATMYDRVRDLVLTAQDIIANSGPVMEDVIDARENARLLTAATGCVKATGECVAKTQCVIERIGDFEFEFDGSAFSINLDLSGLETQIQVRDRLAVESASVADSHLSEAPSRTTAPSTHSRPCALSLDKPLPQVPEVTSPIHISFTQEAASVMSSASALRLELPPLPKKPLTLQFVDEYSPVETLASDSYSYRSDSFTASSSSYANTYLSRSSEASILSHASTRATTPDHALPRSQPSFSDLNATGSSRYADDVDDVESRLLEKTHAHELMFNKEGQVTGGSLAALVERLTAHESTPDAAFVAAFYLTFRLFCTPSELAEALVDRFDHVGEAPRLAVPVRLRAYNVFKGWLEIHWQDESDHEALPFIKSFAQNKLRFALPAAGTRLVELVEKVESSSGHSIHRVVSLVGKTGSFSHFVPADAPVPPSVVTKSQMNSLISWRVSGTSLSILDLDPLEVARQLTLMQMKIFCSILPDELLASKWNKQGGVGSPNVKAMSALTTGLSNLVADTILHYDEVKKRALVTKHWIKIASQCQMLHNYDALMAITSTLSNTSIKRLKMTWDAVSNRRKEALKAMQANVDFSQNYKVLRRRLQDRLPPCLPFLGMFLTDLTFVDVGNPPLKTSDTGLTLINFDKHMRTAKIIGDLQRFQVPYRLHELPDLQHWLDAQIVQVRLRDKANNAQTNHYRKSLMLEPRTLQASRAPDTPGAATLGHGGMFGWLRSNNTSGPALTQPFDQPL